MAAARIFRFDFIAANSGTSVFLHGFGDQEAVSFNGVVFAGFGAGVPNPIAHATVTGGDEIFRHVDGTAAYKIYVQNKAPFNSCTVDILEQFETF